MKGENVKEKNIGRNGRQYALIFKVQSDEIKKENSPMLFSESSAVSQKEKILDHSRSRDRSSRPDLQARRFLSGQAAPLNRSFLSRTSPEDSRWTVSRALGCLFPRPGKLCKAQCKFSEQRALRIVISSRTTYELAAR